MGKKQVKRLNTSVVELCYRTIGNGSENLILIHGLAANMGFWNPLLVIALSRKFRVTLFDLRGHGYSSMPPSDYRAIDMRDDVLSLMDHLGIEKAHLAGHSFGATLALHCALSDPDRIASISLIDTRLKELQPHQRLIDWPNWRETKKDLAAVGLDADEHQENIGLVLLEKFASQDWKSMRKELSDQALFVPFGGRSTGERLAKQWLKLLNETTARHDFNQPDELSIEALASMQKPLLGYFGGNSRCMVTCDNLRKIWPKCLIKIMPDAGHFFPAIHPQAVAETLSDFLENEINYQKDLEGQKPTAAAHADVVRRPVSILGEEAQA
jgi:pimeloyl-ACP methyl ester carboxylesterase